MSFLAELIKPIFSGISGWFLNRYWTKITTRRPHAKVLGISNDEEVHIILPHRPFPVQVSTTLIKKRSHVTFEDMLAANYAERSLTLAGFSDEKVSIKSVKQFKKDRSSLQQQNLILICSPKANDITADTLEALNKTLSEFNLTFNKISTKPDEWGIVFDNAMLESDSYKQIADLISQGIDPEEGTQNDYGVIVRAKNPWNREKKLVIIAGIRGIGTWGAARCLRDKANQLAKSTKGKNFIQIVEIEYGNYKMNKTELTKFFSVLDQ